MGILIYLAVYSVMLYPLLASSLRASSQILRMEKCHRMGLPNLLIQLGLFSNYLFDFVPPH